MVHIGCPRVVRAPCSGLSEGCRQRPERHVQLWEGLASVPGTVCQCPSFHHDSPLGKALPGPQTDRLSRVAEQPG